MNGNEPSCHGDQHGTVPCVLHLLSPLLNGKHGGCGHDQQEWSGVLPSGQPRLRTKPFSLWKVRKDWSVQMTVLPSLLTSGCAYLPGVPTLSFEGRRLLRRRGATREDKERAMEGGLGITPTWTCFWSSGIGGRVALDPAWWVGNGRSLLSGHVASCSLWRPSISVCKDFFLLSARSLFCSGFSPFCPRFPPGLGIEFLHLAAYLFIYFIKLQTEWLSINHSGAGRGGQVWSHPDSLGSGLPHDPTNASPP